jgi:hypothetical protein
MITRGMLKQRWETARFLLSLAGGESWSPGDKASAEGCRTDLEAAFFRNWEIIPSMVRHKAQQQGKQTMDPYKEACPPLLLFSTRAGSALPRSGRRCRTTPQLAPPSAPASRPAGFRRSCTRETPVS